MVCTGSTSTQVTVNPFGPRVLRGAGVRSRLFRIPGIRTSCGRGTEMTGCSGSTSERVRFKRSTSTSDETRRPSHPGSRITPTSIDPVSFGSLPIRPVSVTSTRLPLVLVCTPKLRVIRPRFTALSITSVAQGTDGIVWAAGVGDSGWGLTELDRSTNMARHYFHDPNDPSIHPAGILLERSRRRSKWGCMGRVRTARTEPARSQNWPVQTLLLDRQRWNSS